MTNPIRAGMVGCGALPQKGVLPHLTQADVSTVDLVAVADRDADRAAATAEKFNVPEHFSNAGEMLDSAELDLVLVLTPIPTHYQVASLAVERGKHVYVQKTMTGTVTEADALLSSRDKAGVRLAAAPGYEICTTTGEMRRRVLSGAIGRPCIAYAYTLGFGHEHETQRTGEGPMASIDPTWYYREGGGPLPDVTVYSLQLLTSVLWSVTRVTAMGNRTAPEIVWRDKQIPVETEDNNLVLMEFACGAIAVAAGTNANASRHIPWGGLSIHGTEGVLEITDVHEPSGYPLAFEVSSGGSVDTWKAQLSDQPYLEGSHLDIPEPHVYADIMDLVDAIRDEHLPAASGEQARHVVDIVESARRAVRTGATQDLTTSWDAGA